MTISRALMRLKLLENDRLKEENYLKNAIIDYSREEQVLLEAQENQTLGSGNTTFNPFLIMNSDNKHKWRAKWEGSYASSRDDSRATRNN